MPDASFEFVTNIASVAAQVEQGMGRVSRAVRQAQSQVSVGGPGGGGSPVAALEQQLLGGVSQRLRNIGAALDQSMTTLARDMERRIGRGERVNVGQEVQRLVRGTETQLSALAQDVARGVPAPLRQMLPELQTHLANGASDVLRGADMVYERIATRLREVARQAGTTGVAIPGTQRMARGDLSGVVAGHRGILQQFGRAVDLQRVSTEGVSEAQRLSAYQGIVGRGGFGLTEAEGRQALAAAEREQAQMAREATAQQRRHQNEVQRAEAERLRAERDQAAAARGEALQMRREMRRAREVFSQVQRNRDVRGNPRDLGGARYDPTTGFWYDERGRTFRETEQGGLRRAQSQLRQSGLPGQVTGLEPRDPERFNITQARKELVAVEKSNALINRDLQRKAAAERQQILAQDKQRAATEARAAAERLRNEIASGKAVRLGGTNIIRDRQGVYYTANQGGAFPMSPTGPQGLQLQRAIAQNEEFVRRQADREAQLRARDAARRGRLPRPGAQGVFDRAFSPSIGGGGGRGGFRASDILTTGMSFGRYMVSAAAFGAVLSAVTAVRAAILDYRDSITDLNVALDGTGDASRGFLDNLGETARLAGENPGAALDAAARGIRAFGQGVDSLEGKERVGEEFSRSVAELAVIGDKTLGDASGDMIAIANNFDIATDSLSRINDAIASAKQTIGGDPTQIAQGLAAVGSAAEAAGFSLEETANVISLVQSRTDQSGRAVATRLGRIFSIVGGSSGRSAISELNRSLSEDEQINVNATVAEQLRQLGAVYNDLSTAQQQQLRSALGGTANTKEIIPLLQEQDLLAEALGESYSKAGEGIDEFNRKSQDMRGTVTKIAGDMQRIVVELSEAGLFDAFIFGVSAVEPFLNAIVQVLEVYNALPAPMKSILALTLQLAAAQKLYSMYLNSRLRETGQTVAGVGGIRAARAASQAERIRQQAMAGGFAVAQPGLIGPMATTGASRRGFFARQRAFGQLSPGEAWNRSGQAIGRAIQAPLSTSLTAARTFQRGFGNFVTAPLATATRGLRGFVNAFDPFTVALMGAIAIVSAVNRARETIAATDAAQDLSGRAATGEDLRGQIQAREDTIRESQDARRGVFGAIADFLASGAGSEAEARLQAEVDRLRVAADEIDQQRAEAAGERSISEAAAAIDPSTEGGIEAGLETLETGGRNAATQVNALNEAMRALVERSSEAASAVLNVGQQIEFQQLAGTNIFTALGERQELAANLSPTFGLGIRSTRGFQQQEEFFGGLANIGDEGQQAVNDLIAQYTEAQGGDLGQDQLVQLRDLVLNELDKYGDIGEEGSENRRILEGEILIALKNTRNGVTEIENIAARWSEFLTAQVELASAAGEMAGLQARSTGVGGFAGVASAQERLRRLQQGLALAMETRRNADSEDDVTDEMLEQYRLEIQQAELDVIDAEMSRADALSELAQSRLAPTDELGRLDASVANIRQKMRMTRDEEKLTSLEAELNNLESQRARMLVEQANAQRTAEVDARDEVGRAQAEATNAYATLQQIIESGDRSSQAYWNALDSYAQAVHAARQAEIERAIAWATARTDPRDEIAGAQVQLSGTAMQIEAALPGSTEQANLARQFREQQQQLDQLVRDQWAAYRVALVDPRDTIGNTQAELTNLWAEWRAALPGSAQQHELTRQINETNQRLREEQVAIANAAAMVGVDPASSLQQAAVELENARRTLSTSLPGTQEYYDNLQAVNQAMFALSQAHLEAASIRRQLSIDLTDPVATAEEELQSVRDRIRDAVGRGAPEDVVNALRVEEQQAMANAEAAAFQQRLSDVQTAEQLGRISHQAYIQYLEQEAARLRAISDRTRQQQDQLNQVELLLQQATETAAGMWNIGDIRMPTPYEVRRAMEAHAQGMTLGESFRATQDVTATRVTNDNRQANITVYGADAEQVRAMIAEYFGPTTVRRSSTGVSGGRI